MSKKKENSFLMQGAILAATALITKIIGLAYRIPVTNIMGAEGNGYYGMVFQLLTVCRLPYPNWYLQEWLPDSTAMHTVFSVEQ